MSSMQIFLDTADIVEIREAHVMGILDGVTTNPTLIAKTGRDFRSVVREILAEVKGPVSLETVSLDKGACLKHPKSCPRQAGSPSCGRCRYDAHAVLKQLMQHPLTDIGIERFLKDWKKVPEKPF